jgi:hypothetical protein
MSTAGNPFGGNHTAGYILQLAQSVIVNVTLTLKADPAMEGREGCYFCVADSAATLLSVIIGNLQESDRWVYEPIVREKAAWVAAYGQLSRDALERHAGGIRGKCLSYAISGYPPDVDEMLSLIIMSHLDDPETPQAEQAVEKSGNSYYECLKHFVHRRPVTIPDIVSAL